MFKKLTMYGFLFLILILSVYSCRAPFEIFDTEGIDISKLKNNQFLMPRRDGVYNLYDSAKIPNNEEKVNEYYSFSKPLIFINDSSMKWLRSSFLDDSPLRFGWYKTNNSFREFGKFVGSYRVFNDTIIAKIPIAISARGGQVKFYKAYFMGVVMNESTIADWHMVQPYPNVPRMFRKFKYYTTPHTFNFIEGPELLGLDSLYRESLKVKSK
jgi:hypothetical protein